VAKLTKALFKLLFWKVHKNSWQNLMIYIYKFPLFKELPMCPLFAVFLLRKTTALPLETCDWSAWDLSRLNTSVLWPRKPIDGRIGRPTTVLVVVVVKIPTSLSEIKSDLPFPYTSCWMDYNTSFHKAGETWHLYTDRYQSLCSYYIIQTRHI
jgi:hypothetical protein